MKHELMDQILKRFAVMLKKRLTSSSSTSEDSIRYTFLHCLSHFGHIDPLDIELEYSYPNGHETKTRKLDAYVAPKGNRWGLAFEFKFDRGNPGGKNPNSTWKAGKALADISRLASFERRKANLRRYFVYVVDKDMMKYYKNNLSDLFNLKHGKKLRLGNEFKHGRPKTIQEALSGGRMDCDIICTTSQQLERTFFLRVYQVRPW